MTDKILRAVVFSVICAVTLLAHAAEQRPNVLLIVADDLGLADLSCCGAKQVKTPHLDALFARGMRLTRFYASSSLCSPSRAAMMTGRYPDLVAPPGNLPAGDTKHLVAYAVTLPSALKKVEYQTAIIGKWHLGETSPNLPTENGFDEFRGITGPMVKDYFTHAQQKGTAKGLWHNTTPLALEGHVTDILTGWAVDYIQNSSKTGNPFFLYLAYNAPHSPHQAPPEWLARVRSRLPDLSEARAQYIAQVEHLDDGIGKVLAALRSTGQEERTFVIFTSDNGGRPGLTQPTGLRGGKNDLYEGGLRVPFCAVWPGRIAPNSSSDRVVLGMDLYPTICEAAGASFDADINGRSFLPTLLGCPQADDDRTLIWTVTAGKSAGADAGRPMYACRRGDWKLVQAAPSKPMELFNLRDDPGEKNPLPATHPEFVRLQQELDKHLARVRSRTRAERNDK